MSGLCQWKLASKCQSRRLQLPTTSVSSCSSLCCLCFSNTAINYVTPPPHDLPAVASDAPAAIGVLLKIEVGICRTRCRGRRGPTRRKGNEEGVPPPQLTRGSGERWKLPQWGPGQSPGQKGFQCISSLKKHHLLASNYGRPAQQMRTLYLWSPYGIGPTIILVHGQVTIMFIVSVCLFVCAEFFSAVFDPISIKLRHMVYVWV